MAEEHVLLVCIEFTDPTMMVQPLFVGSREDCGRARDKAPALTYSGEKQVDKAYAIIRTVAEWTRIQDEYGV